MLFEFAGAADNNHGLHSPAEDVRGTLFLPFPAEDVFFSELKTSFLPFPAFPRLQQIKKALPQSPDPERLAKDEGKNW